MYVCMHAYMYVCMHACMCVSMYVLMYVCIYIYIYIYIYVCMYACMYVCMHACMYECMHVCMYMYVCTYVCMYVLRNDWVYIVCRVYILSTGHQIQVFRCTICEFEYEPSIICLHVKISYSMCAWIIGCPYFCMPPSALYRQ